MARHAEAIRADRAARAESAPEGPAAMEVPAGTLWHTEESSDAG